MPAKPKPDSARASKPSSEPSHAAPREPAREAIAKRAYELYLQRGSLPGYELEDWLAAEAELISQAASDRAGD